MIQITAAALFKALSGIGGNYRFIFFRNINVPLDENNVLANSRQSTTKDNSAEPYLSFSSNPETASLKLVGIEIIGELNEQILAILYQNNIQIVFENCKISKFILREKLDVRIEFLGSDVEEFTLEKIQSLVFLTRFFKKKTEIKKL